MKNITIKTSNPNWMNQLIQAYKDKRKFIFLDDRELGINLSKDSLSTAGKKGNLTAKDWAIACLGMGMTGAGIWMIRGALVDPEPTSKLALLTFGGIICSLYGVPFVMTILSNRMPPTVKLTTDGFEYSWR